jgi:hypothetical protein
MKLCWGKKIRCILFTATHSLRSSPSGSMTAKRKFPCPKVVDACLSKSIVFDSFVVSFVSFFVLKVLTDLLPLKIY